MRGKRKEGRREGGKETVGADRGPPVHTRIGPPLHTRIAAALKRIAGMPDYAAHLDHLRRSHPGRPIPTEREFYEEFLRVRYGDSASRCC